MDRIQVLQNFIDKKNYSNYLEIGTFKGQSLLPLKCKRKIAVDPDFQISKRNRLKWCLKNPCNIFNRYFEMRSEDFFQKKANWLRKKGKRDLVFIDGLHTFKASLSDVLNSLGYLDSKGTIILHDCFPPNKAAATPAESIEDANQMQIEGWKKEWCGDVWKTIVYLKEQYNEELEVFVLNRDYGLGIIRPKLNGNFSVTINEELYKKIEALDYEHLKSNPDEILGIRDIKKMEDFFVR